MSTTSPLSKSVAVIVPVVIGTAGVATMTVTAYLLQNKTVPSLDISSHPEVNSTLTMQMVVLLASFLALGFMRFYRRETFDTFFRFKFISSDSDWNITGPILAVIFTLGTTMYMSFSVMNQHGQFNQAFFKLLPLVLLFAATNAWSEEIFTRFVVISGLFGKLGGVTICWISAAVFGLPHFFGTPSGPVGVIMAGLMGWLLAKSVVETKSMGWALLIHFLQDVVIFGAGAMVLAKG